MFGTSTNTKFNLMIGERGTVLLQRYQRVVARQGNMHSGDCRRTAEISVVLDQKHVNNVV
jgi:hypothetical protein